MSEVREEPPALDTGLFHVRRSALEAALTAAAGRSVNSAQLIAEAKEIEAYLLGHKA